MSPASAETVSVDVTAALTECHVRDGRIASPCQISRRSVIPLLRYRRLSICKMATVRHLGFQKSGNFIGWRGRDAYPSQILSKLSDQSIE